MAFAKANPNEYLVIGRGGKVINRGTGINTFLWPGSTYVLIPSTKQEATFEMTQETTDGIPLHFKGIVIYRINEPTVAAANFNFNEGTGIQEINILIRNICLGELRAVVSGMTMQECIEQRKTVLTTAVETALNQVVLLAKGSDTTRSNWGIELEMVQVAQVYIIDNEIRKQLEAEVRNDIRAKSDQSTIRTQEDTKLAQIASDRRIQGQKLEAEKDSIHQKEEISLANLQFQRRLQKENQESEREAILLALEKFRLEKVTEREKTEMEAPVRLLQIENQQAILNQELAMRQIENQVRQLEVDREMMGEIARHNLQKETMPMELAPVIAESLSKVFQGAHLSYFGGESQTLAPILSLFDFLSKLVREPFSENGGAEERSGR
jgi:flotillin